MSYPLFLTVTTVTVTSSLFSLFPYEASKCPEQFVGQIRGGLWSFSEDRRHDDVCSLILSNPYHSALKVIKVPRSIFGRIMITALELASLCKAKNRPPITRFLFFYLGKWSVEPSPDFTEEVLWAAERALYATERNTQRKTSCDYRLRPDDGGCPRHQSRTAHQHAVALQHVTLALTGNAQQ